ncbi:MAG: cob(I)yrinic acid a,c-diamide adenosyltransferase [Bacteroidota bacterium]
MKIYTKGGDQGSTSLFSGKRVSKAALRVAAYGDLDELNAQIGRLRDFTQGPLVDPDTLLLIQQQHLFVIGAQLADDREGVEKMQLPKGAAPTLEAAIDRMQEQLEPLRHFLLPGGHPAVSQAHICRTVCRRAERQVVLLVEEVSLAEDILPYLNRLSDYFFVLGRYLAKLSGTEEIRWLP